MATHRPPARLPRSADDPLWTRNDALIATGATAMDLFGYGLGAAEGLPVTSLGLFLAALAGLPLLAHRRHPPAVLAAVLAVSLVQSLTAPMAHHFNTTIAVALFLATRTGRAAVIVPGALTAVVVPLVGQGRILPPPAADLGGVSFAVALVVGSALAASRWQREMAIKRTLLADRAVADERRRIARELHDIVAHHITTMQLMAGGARANLDRDTEVVREALVSLEGSGRMALREMRQLLDVLRAGDEPEESPAAPQPGVGDLRRLVEESERAGLPTELTVHGEERPLPPSVGLTVYRIVQEALTNTRKHAGPTRARVRLTYRADEIAVEVQDDGAGVPVGVGAAGGAGVLVGAGGPAGAKAPAGARGHRGGYGLTGMRERVALHGGSLTVGGLDGGGFQVAAGLPLPPSSAGGPSA
ncbi:sensor histidine kinase [Kitasatospora sp. NBC_00458]|uniref:sensor histidine kinase n=1 Tax=Kitasatospora sp. NBC_00458 TaxID=2903568 RepID=UPI002E186161